MLTHWKRFLTLSKEVKDFGIRVIAVAPGQFRTDWTGRSMMRSERANTEFALWEEMTRSTDFD